MASRLGSGGISLAPTPIHLHQLSREPSREDIEMAENLSLLNHSQDLHTPRTVSDPHEQLATPSQGRASEIYHSLDDTLSFQRSEPPDHALAPAISDPLSHANLSGANAPIMGQICSNCETTQTPLWRRSPAGETICNACGLYYKARNQARPTNLKRTIQAQPIAPIQRSPTPGQRHDRSVSPNTAGSPHGATYVAVDPVPVGTCPGGGRCNGTGGQQGCSGCPAYNNRVSKTAQYALAQANAASNPGETTNPIDGGQPVLSGTHVIPACQNCGTVVTPLWRRDKAGLNICNACGLYYKLHGTHRPVTLKKPEIKRRKRIVPVKEKVSQSQLSNASYSPQLNATQTPISEHSVSPGPSTTIERSEPQLHERRGPVAIDFTNFYSSTNAASRPQELLLPPTTHTNAPSPRKRSLSATLDPEEATTVPAIPIPHRPNAISSILNPTRPFDSNIDPSLSNLPRLAKSPGVDNRPRASPVSHEEKAAKRERLQREAELMRGELAKREKELEELED